MRQGSWVWWTTEPALRLLYLALGAIGLALLVKLTWVLVMVPDATHIWTRFDRAEHCMEAPVAAPTDLPNMLKLLQHGEPQASDCWKAVALPWFEEPAAENGSERLGRAWFRFRHLVPTNWSGRQPLMIYAPRLMASAWRVSIDGKAVADNLDDWRMTWNRPLAVQIPPALLRPGQRIGIDIELVHRPDIGHSLFAVYLGPADVLGRWLGWRSFLQFTMPLACSAVLIVLAIFFFAFWCLRHKETVHLLLASASIAWSVCNLQYVLPRPDAPLAASWYDAIVNLSVVWFMWLVYQFVLLFDGRRIRWIDWAMPLYVVLMTFLALPLFSSFIHDDISTPFQVVNAVVSTAITGWIAWLAWRGGGLEMKVIAATLAMTLVVGAHDLALLAQLLPWESIYLLPYGGLIVFGSLLFAVQRRYVHAIDGHEKLAASLAERLVQRETELLLNHQRLREIEREQTLAVERQRLMRDMHDGLGSALISSLKRIERGEAEPSVLAGMLRECIDDLRAVIDSLDPLDHELEAILSTLRFRLKPRLEAAGIQLDWSMENLPSLNWMGPPEALQLIRIIQEALANVLKHANARHVSLSATRNGDVLELCIKDDGQGFDTGVSSHGRGLRFLAQRAASLRGSVSVETYAGQGTMVRLTLPLA